MRSRAPGELHAGLRAMSPSSSRWAKNTRSTAKALLMALTEKRPSATCSAT